MTDIDLIPRDYTEGQRLRRWLRNFAIALGMVVAATIIGRSWIALRLSEERPTVEHMRQQARQAADQQAQLSALDARKTAAEARMATLRSLRDGTTWVAMFHAIDEAYNRNLWFDELAFSRTMVIDPPAANAPPADIASHEATSTAPKVGHAFDIRGHALDHAAVTDFMRSLGERPGVRALRLTDTGLRKYSTMEVVDFSLAATLDSNRQATP